MGDDASKVQRDPPDGVKKTRGESHNVCWSSHEEWSCLPATTSSIHRSSLRHLPVCSCRSRRSAIPGVIISLASSHSSVRCLPKSTEPIRLYILKPVRSWLDIFGPVRQALLGLLILLGGRVVLIAVRQANSYLPRPLRFNVILVTGRRCDGNGVWCLLGSQEALLPLKGVLRSYT